jgi:YD repeat-containing protein
MINTTYPSGRTVNYSHDPMGRINTISTTDASSNTTVIASNIQYLPFGGVQSYTYGDGQVAQTQFAYRQHDRDGRIASYLLNGQLQLIGYDAASQISFIDYRGGPITPPSLASYTYDPMSRLTGYTQDTTLNHSYTYDPVGNRTSQLIGSTTTNYGIDPMSNKLASIQSGAGAPQIVTQDAIGATTSDAAHQYAYDVRGRLIQATTAQGQINYEVNALGLRIRKQVPYANTDTQYHYDTQGHLIGENTTGTTQFSREYIWLGDIPVAVMQ